ncbi:hypothetical protein LG288_04475 [Idiomarina seosinensis]|uniref:hypothetical protein n=1 Tax=Idiomarina seosinensis TaxID=281739 RepID=UPI00384E3D6C
MTISLFGLLLSSAALLLIEQRLRYEQLTVDVMINQISNRRNLLRTLYHQLGRWPTVAELRREQAASAIDWPFDIVQSQPLQWQLKMSGSRWQHRLIERVGGEVNGGYWAFTEPLPGTQN